MKMRNSNSTKLSGFTLIETLIYAVMVSMTIGFVLAVVYQLIESRYRSLARTEVEEETNFLIRKIAWALSGISAINEPAPNATSTSLSVNKVNFSPNPVVIQAFLSKAIVRYGSGSTSTLNSDSVAVRQLLFEQVGSSSNPGVKVTLTTEFIPRGQLTIYNATSLIQTTIYVRK